MAISTFPFIHIALLAWAAFLLPCAHAKDGKQQQLSEWSLGETLFGEEVKIDDLAGKVVVLEYWGVRCPPCIASLPHLAKLDRRYRDDGLVIIGAESQGHSKKQIEPVLKGAKVEYTITKGARGPVNVRGIPHILVFDRAGNKVFDGRPSDRKFDSAVKDALKEDPPAGTGDEPEDEPLGRRSKLFEQQEWTNAEGQTMKAAVKKADKTTVTFIMPNGAGIEFPMEKLSEESRDKILKALEE
ncbi:MAG: TlpA disulfide reductase family protein [Akkermansiaceae bacterium]|nr:TlpA disulfide reductase family protein [Akkermansiaceae bacterium]